ncbi:MAG TPA: lysophospholipid acyltransferase family protein [Candidatus Limnocylindrales bacterium]|nr:lysophospholipid acyltransferase family protein [Candidatus Limnocylindrales bacterium]
MPETTQAEIKPQEVTGGIRHLGSRLRSYFVWTPLVWLYTVVLGCVSLLVSLFDPTGERQQKIARLWSQMILWTVGATVEVEGLGRIDISKPQVYVVNHLSAFDIPVLYTHLPFQFRILAKKELFRYPFMGWHLRRSGQIPVVLENPKASVRSLNLAVASIRKGNSLVIFPEGGRSPNGQLQSFMGGAFYAAVKAQVDVVPIVLVGTYEMLKMNSYHIKPGPIQMVVGSPISTAGMSTRDIAKITEHARIVMGDLYYSRCLVPDLRTEQPVTNESTKL